MASTIDLATALSAMRAAGLISDETDTKGDERPRLPEPVGPASPWTPTERRRPYR